MARSRLIKPALFDNEDLAECSVPARFLFIGLWCWADCTGTLEDRPKRIKAQVFPYDSKQDVSALITELQEYGFVVRYTVGTRKYLYIPNFGKHQRPHPKEVSFDFPECPENILLAVKRNLITHTSPEKDSMNGTTRKREKGRKGKGKKGEREEGEGKMFEAFYSVYPKKKKRQDAMKAFVALDPGKELLETMISAVKAQSLEEDWKKEGGKYIPFPASWIRGRRWEDESPDAKPPEPDTIPCPKCEGHGSYLAKRYPACAEEELFSCQNCKRTGRIPK
jgi:hypothetical protein